MLRNALILSWAITALASTGIIFRGINEAQAARDTETELASVCVDEVCGYVNSNGGWHIPPKFRAADPFSEEGLAWLITYDGVTDGTKYIGAIKKYMMLEYMRPILFQVI